MSSVRAFRVRDNAKEFRSEMLVSHGKLLLLAGVVCIGSIEVSCIVSKTSSNDVEKSDNAAESSIKRDYVAGYDEAGYGHGGYGLSGHSDYGGGHEGYGVLEGGKHYIHYPEDHHHHHQEHHKHYDVGYHKALAIKSLLVPLAGVALLGAAAAFVSNPVLLQLGVISSSSLGRRKRDVTGSDVRGRPLYEDRLEEMSLLGRFMGQVPGQRLQSQERRMVADYLACSAKTKNLCLERLACELHSPERASMAMEANVMTIVLKGIQENEFVRDDVKRGLKTASERGRANSGCGVYKCPEMDAE